MTKILFVCHGNICRSPAAEMVMRKLTAGNEEYVIDSAATTTEEIGNEIYPPMRRTLMNHNIPLVPHRARKTTRADYGKYDYIIGMDEENRYDLHRIYGGDPEGKVSLLMSWAGEDAEVSDPWYTRDFDMALQDIMEGCKALYQTLTDKKRADTNDGNRV
ncbi:MAG: low molecular weight phosphotyrosine protein phosphatase [Clostridia bacterium]|nr:low molecular weight phosphotyrosine protein phosphatase [Clostridia bacterium]